MNSLEKLNAQLRGAGDLVPETEEQATLMQMLNTAGPFLGSIIPDDPEVLDGQLLALAAWALKLRSDTAPPAPAIRMIAEAYADLRTRAGLGEDHIERELIEAGAS